MTDLPSKPASTSSNIRLQLVELLAYWEGYVNTRALREQFNISRQQASADLQLYRQTYPEHLHYCATRKAYLAAVEFTPQIISGDVADYLNWLHSRQLKPPFSDASPLCTVLSLPSRRVSPTVMRALVEAVRSKQRVEVDYVSLSSASTEGRVIAPHNFVKTGLRWHLRAWCEKSNQYRDFVLSRFRGNPELSGATAHLSEGDLGWNTKLTLIIEPDQRLSSAQKRVLEQDYGMVDGQMRIVARACTAQYILQDLQISTKVLDGTPEAQQLVLVNKADIKPWLFDG